MKDSVDTKGASMTADYAAQWIDYLKKRNSLLGLLVFFLLFVSLVSAGAAFYFQQAGVSKELEKALVASQLEEAGRSQTEIERRLSDLQSQFDEKVAQLDAQKNAYEEKLLLTGSESQASNEKAMLDAQVIDNLKSQLLLLNEEKSSLSESLEEAQALLVLHKSKLDKEQESQAQLAGSVGDLKKELESRKVAYQALTKRLKELQGEIDRLANLNLQQEKEIKRSKQTVASLNKQLSSNTQAQLELNQQINSLQAENAELSAKLASVVSPIGAASTVSKKQSSQSAAASSQTASPSKSLAFEEIKVVKSSPKEEPVKDTHPAQNTYDYDQISVP